MRQSTSILPVLIEQGCSRAPENTGTLFRVPSPKGCLSFAMAVKMGAVKLQRFKLCLPLSLLIHEIKNESRLRIYRQKPIKTQLVGDDEILRALLLTGTMPPQYASLLSWRTAAYSSTLQHRSTVRHAVCPKWNSRLQKTLYSWATSDMTSVSSEQLQRRGSHVEPIHRVYREGTR